MFSSNSLKNKSIHPLLNPNTYITALKLDVLDAPGLKGNSHARGILQTRMIDGACYAVDEEGQLLPEYDRLMGIVPDVVGVVKTRFMEARTREGARIPVR
jgi:hypothetical protein